MLFALANGSSFEARFAHGRTVYDPNSADLLPSSLKVRSTNLFAAHRVAFRKEGADSEGLLFFVDPSPLETSQGFAIRVITRERQTRSWPADFSSERRRQ